ncbi:MAG: MFS transporter [Chloroflexota bacterium]|jgi:MFS family permease|nr:MFS transporter [Aggregatilineaceae bacterium]
MQPSSNAQASPEHASANYRHLVGDVFWFGVAFPSTARFLSIYAIRLDASAALLGWISALPAIILLITSALAPWWRKRYGSTVGALFWPGLGFRLVFLLPALTPVFPHAFQPYWLLLAVALPALAQGVSSVLFLVVLREGVDARDLPGLMSRRSFAFNVAVGLATVGFGFWLSEVTFPFNYQAMFVAAFAVSLISLWHVQALREINPSTMPQRVKGAMRALLRTPVFQRVASTSTLVHLSFFSILPIIPLWLVNRFDADEQFLSYFGLVEIAAAALIATQTGRIVRRLGTRATIAAGLAITGVAAGLLAAAPSLPVTLVAAAISGAAWTATSISVFTYFSENTPPENVTHFSTAYNQVVSLAIFVGPLLGSQLAGLLPDLSVVLLIGAVLRLAAAALIPLDLFGRDRRTPLPEPQPEIDQVSVSG